MRKDKEVKATTKACTKLVPPPTKQASNINASLEVSNYEGSSLGDTLNHPLTSSKPLELVPCLAHVI